MFVVWDWSGNNERGGGETLVVKEVGVAVGGDDTDHLKRRRIKKEVMLKSC